MTLVVAGCGADGVGPVAPTASAATTPSASVSVEPPGPPPTTALFVSFDAEPTEATDAIPTLDAIVSELAKTGGGRVELTGSALSTSDSTNDRSKALRRGEALRNWFIEHKVSGAKVVVKNPGPPCAPKAGEDPVRVCRGVQVDVWR